MNLLRNLPVGAMMHRMDTIMKGSPVKKTVLILCPECKHQIEVNPGALLSRGSKTMTDAARTQRANALNARWTAHKAHKDLMSACGKYGILEPNDVYVKILDARRVNGLTEYLIMTDYSKRWVSVNRVVVIREEDSNER